MRGPFAGAAIVLLPAATALGACRPRQRRPEVAVRS
jgi:hypothetical protein